MRELVGKIILDRYRVDKFLGSGGMAEVYKVWDTHRNAWLAMKVLHSDLALDHAFLRRFRREAKTLERLQHPNIVRFYGLEQHDRLIFMLMDFVDGESLKPKIFDAQGHLPFEQVYAITSELAWALKYAHSEGLVHSDVKPANIMLDEKGHVMLSDFGIARMEGSLTMTMVGAGTPAYMAPEQIRGEPPSTQTDIYALGIVLYEMLTGERPFNGELATISGTVGEKIRWEQMNLNVPSPTRLNKKITPELEDLVLRALAKNKHDRFKDVGEFLAEFSQIFQDDVYRHRPVSSERERREKEAREAAEKAVQDRIAKEKREIEEEQERKVAAEKALQDKITREKVEAEEKKRQVALRKELQKERVDNFKQFFLKNRKKLTLIIGGTILLFALGFIISNIKFQRPAVEIQSPNASHSVPGTYTALALTQDKESPLSTETPNPSSNHSVVGTYTAMALTQNQERLVSTSTPMQILNVENNVELVRVRSMNWGKNISVAVNYSYNGEYGSSVNLFAHVDGISCTSVDNGRSVITPKRLETATMSMAGCLTSLADGETYKVKVWMTAAGHGTFFEETFDYKYIE